MTIFCKKQNKKAEKNTSFFANFGRSHSQSVVTIHNFVVTIHNCEWGRPTTEKSAYCSRQPLRRRISKCSLRRAMSNWQVLREKLCTQKVSKSEQSRISYNTAFLLRRKFAYWNYKRVECIGSLWLWACYGIWCLEARCSSKWYSKGFCQRSLAYNCKLHSSTTVLLSDLPYHWSILFRYQRSLLRKAELQDICQQLRDKPDAKQRSWNRRKAIRSFQNFSWCPMYKLTWDKSVVQHFPRHDWGESWFFWQPYLCHVEAKWENK